MPRQPGAPKLRPINETRRPNGQLTSETAARLLRRRGGLASAKEQAKDGYSRLAWMRPISAMVRQAKSRQKGPCPHCKAMAETLLRVLKDKNQRSSPSPMSEVDRNKLR